MSNFVNIDDLIETLLRPAIDSFMASESGYIGISTYRHTHPATYEVDSFPPVVKPTGTSCMTPLTSH